MKHFILIIGLLIISVGTMACSCAPAPDYKTLADLQPFDFIALVSIKHLPAKTGNQYMNLRVSGDIGISIKELFKGDITSLVFDSSFSNDCALTLHENDEWLFFGTGYHGKIMVGRCNYSRIFRDSTGMRDWVYLSGPERLNMLRVLYGHNILADKRSKIFYPNGNIEIEQAFKRGKLSGVRKIYYPNGKLYVAEEFIDGKRINYRNIYHINGQLRYQTIYEKGLISQHVIYQDTTEHAWYLNYQITHNKDLLFGDKTRTPEGFKIMLDSLRNLKDWAKQTEQIRKFSPDGRSNTFEAYSFKGYLEAESYLNWDKRVEEFKRYYAKGKIQYEIKYDQMNDSEVEHDYTPDGTRRDFVKKCVSCKSIFDGARPPEAIPEAIYF